MIRTHTYYVSRKEYYRRFLYENEKYNSIVCDNTTTRVHIRFT